MQAAGGADDVESGPQIEVVGIAEDDLGAHFAEFAGVEGLDGGLRADGHEGGGVHGAAGGAEHAEARLSVRVGFEEVEHEEKAKG